jgi:hypothetical protein
VVVYDDVVLIFYFSVVLFGFGEKLEGIVLGLFKEDGNVFEVLFIVNVVVEFVFDFALPNKFGDFIIVVYFFDFNLFGHFLEDQLLDNLFLVVVFFVFDLNRFPLVLETLNSSDIVLIE